MAGPRKVRVFCDPKKSPHWYVEYRDNEGKRHSESCGPDKQYAQKRADQITAQLLQQRQQTAIVAPTRDYHSIELRGMLSCDDIRVPIAISVGVSPTLRTALRRWLLATDGPNITSE